MSARELLGLPPAEWAEAIELMSWRELRDVADKRRHAAGASSGRAGYERSTNWIKRLSLSN